MNTRIGWVIEEAPLSEWLSVPNKRANFQMASPCGIVLLKLNIKRFRQVLFCTLREPLGSNYKTWIQLPLLDRVRSVCCTLFKTCMHHIHPYSSYFITLSPLSVIAKSMPWTLMVLGWSVNRVLERFFDGCLLKK